MTRSPTDLRDDALAIWRAGVAAVDSQHLVESHIQFHGDVLRVAEQAIPFVKSRRIAIVGAGKAGAAMAAGAEQALQQALDQVTGWVNVPEDCIRSLEKVHVHGARPAGVNEPTEEGVAGAREILRIVGGLADDDICICLISGGGSALLPLPKDGVTLHDKQVLTRHLSAAGANIAELNTVRKQLSQIKGGGLARACQAGQLITLIISDVIGDPLDMIASGPTVPDSTTAEDALAVLEKYEAEQAGASVAVWDLLRGQAGRKAPAPTCATFEHVIGNNATAVNAAAAEAVRRGYKVCAEPAEHLEGDVSQVAVELAQRMEAMSDGALGYDCLITGGEPTVTLAPPSERGRGGRNQQLVAVVMQHLRARAKSSSFPADMALVSGGTDGEDGPTDAAGAWVDGSLPPFSHDELLSAIQRNDTYSFFNSLDALVKTGPTQTNVCDVRVALVAR